MNKHERVDWVLSTQDGNPDVHMLWESEIGEHDLDNGTHCRCCPSIVRLEKPTNDPEGKPIYSAIRHRPAIERAYVPKGMPEELT